MKTLEINEISSIIAASPREINLMFLGDTGVGKTSVIEKHCKDNGIFCKTLILSQIEASESLGIPIQTEIELNGETYPVLKTAIPYWAIELAQHDNAILYLDEFLCAEPSVMNAFLNFLSQKKVGDIDLSHVQVVAASNIGKYTFEPDSNMLSRFCMFYAENTTFNKYIKSSISNSYVDECAKTGVIFDKRSLKPRCQEQLSLVKPEFISSFFEGFTNDKYCSVHINPQYNEILAAFVSVNTDDNSEAEFVISNTSIATLVGILKKRFPRVRRWDSFANGIRNLHYDLPFLMKEFSK